MALATPAAESLCVSPERERENCEFQEKVGVGTTAKLQRLSRRRPRAPRFREAISRPCLADYEPLAGQLTALAESWGVRGDLRAFRLAGYEPLAGQLTASLGQLIGPGVPPSHTIIQFTSCIIS